jgi:hypothetical protein
LHLWWDNPQNCARTHQHKGHHLQQISSWNFAKIYFWSSLWVFNFWYYCLCFCVSSNFDFIIFVFSAYFIVLKKMMLIFYLWYLHVKEWECSMDFPFDDFNNFSVQYASRSCRTPAPTNYTHIFNTDEPCILFQSLSLTSWLFLFRFIA